MARDGSCICGEHGVVYRLVVSVCCAPKIKVTLYVNNTSIKKRRNVENCTIYENYCMIDYF